MHTVIYLPDQSLLPERDDIFVAPDAATVAAISGEKGLISLPGWDKRTRIRGPKIAAFVWR